MEKILENYEPSNEVIPVVTYPDPVLSTVASEVAADEFNQDLKQLIIKMLNTMYDAPGIGLAAPQIGISKRIFVMDVDYNRDEDESTGKVTISDTNPEVLINPVFIAKDGEHVYQEGCLSLPGIYENVKRYNNVKVEYQNTDGEKMTIEADGLRAICLQHENDHLDGIVFIDRLSSLKKSFFRKKLIKAKRR